VQLKDKTFRKNKNIINKKEITNILHHYKEGNMSFSAVSPPIFRLNLPRFTGHQDKTIINLMEVQVTWKERKDNLLRNLRKRQLSTV